MFPVIIGATLAVVIALLARITNFDRDRSFYAIVLMTIASYYVLFGCMANEAISSEIVVASAFFLIAIAGALRWPFLLGIGLIAHGIFDLLHGVFISNSGVPTWWPEFCASIDIVLGLWVSYLAKSNRITTDLHESK